MRLPAVVCTPLVANRSLMPSGTPDSGFSAPSARARSAGVGRGERVLGRFDDIGVERAALVDIGDEALGHFAR
jgi:hypothetical protein